MIMRDGLHVRGLNTAATMWCAAAIGTLVGVGERAMPALAAVTVVAANVVLRELAVWIDKKHAASGGKRRFDDRVNDALKKDGDENSLKSA